MYEDDTPPEERRAQALSLDRDLLRELMGVEELRELLDAGRDRAGRRLAAAARRGTPTSCTTCFVARGRSSTGEYDAGFAETLVRERRAFRRAARERRGRSPRSRTPASSATRFGVVPPGRACRTSSSSPCRTRCASCSAGTRGRTGRSRRPRSPARFGLDPASLEAELRGARAAGRSSSAASSVPAAREREWCDPDVLRRIRRATLAVLRREVEPAEQAALGRFLPAWHGIGRRQTLREALVPLQGLALPVSLWESDVLPRRVPGVPPGRPRRALRLRRGRLGRRRARPRRRLLPRGRVGCSARRPPRRRPKGAAHVGVRAALARGARLLARPRSRRPGSTPRRRSPRSGSSSGRAR